MKRIGKYSKVIAMSAAALAMMAALSIQSSMAYFTTYVSAGGGGEVSLRIHTVVHEDVSEMTKHITIENVEDNDCFVRVRAFYSGLVSIEYKNVGGGDGWYDGGDGYWYYRPVLRAHSTSSQLDVKIIVPEEFDKDTFNVVVVQECTPVIYDDAGNPGAEWDTVYSDYQRGGKN